MGLIKDLEKVQIESHQLVSNEIKAPKYKDRLDREIKITNITIQTYTSGHDWGIYKILTELLQKRELRTRTP